MNSLTVLLVDDHAIVREGVRRLMSHLPESRLMEAENVNETMAILRKTSVDVILLDLNLEGLSGLELVRRILVEHPKARIIVFTMHAEALYALCALRMGAKGYVSKGAAAVELLAALRHVAGGGTYIERELAGRLAASEFSGTDPLSTLTTREVEIMRLLGEGKSLGGIAQSLGVAYKTVANTCSLLKQKLGLQSTAALIKLSIDSRDRS